jgi:type I restriction enzyme M protein
MNMNEIVTLTWGAKEILRGKFKKNQWGDIILPFVVLRRLERVLEPTKMKVLEEYEKIKEMDETLIEARLNQITGQYFHNKSPYNLELLLADPNHIYRNIKKYCEDFSGSVREIFDNFNFYNTIEELHKRKLLYQIVQHFAKAPLDVQTIDNHMMGTIYEELIRKSSEAANDEAGEHFTPREVIKLMVYLLFTHDIEFLNQKYLIRTIYDPAAGTGGMLSIASEYINKLNPNSRLDVFGQELNPETYAICKSDMMLKGFDLNRIKLGNSLTSEDGFPNEQFHYMLSNPPFGVDWRKDEVEIKLEADKGFKGKYGPGQPRKSDGSLLFLLHMISKMKSPEQGGSRIAIVFNGSPLFTGEAGSGECNIRKWLIENDMIETIISLPDQLFYNTGIFTYIWIISNSKKDKRKGKVQLINGISFYEKMKNSLGHKRNYIGDSQIDSLVEIYQNFKENKFCKILDNIEFGYTKITIERPLRQNFQITENRLERLKNTPAFHELPTIPTKPKEPTQDLLIKVLKTISPEIIFKNNQEFSNTVKDAFSKAGFKLNPNILKSIESSLSERDDCSSPCLSKTNMPVPDRELRDYENVPLKEDIERYFNLNVKPFVQDAWIGESSRNIIGYEILFNKFFYEYIPLRPLEKIIVDIKKIEQEIIKEIGELLD